MEPTDNAPVWFMAFRLVVSSNWVYWVELVAIQLIVSPFFFCLFFLLFFGGVFHSSLVSSVPFPRLASGRCNGAV